MLDGTCFKQRRDDRVRYRHDELILRYARKALALPPVPWSIELVFCPNKHSGHARFIILHWIFRRSPLEQHYFLKRGHQKERATAMVAA